MFPFSMAFFTCHIALHISTSVTLGDFFALPSYMCKLQRTTGRQTENGADQGI